MHYNEKGPPSDPGFSKVTVEDPAAFCGSEGVIFHGLSQRETAAPSHSRVLMALS